MNRFFVNKQDIAKDSAIVRDANDVKHISRVLRLQKGEKIFLCDGEANEYLCEITQIEKDKVHTRILSAQRSRSELPCRITLYQGLPKAGKMELIIQKCVELGVSEIRPILTKRCVVRPDEDFPRTSIFAITRLRMKPRNSAGGGYCPWYTRLKSSAR